MLDPLQANLLVKVVLVMDEKRLINRQIPVLDGLRGLAIIAVIVCHVNHSYGGPFMPGRVNGLLAMVFGWGWVGVDLFFALSGFLITGILFDAKGCDGFFRNFYARRTLRIMPLYFGFLFFIVVMNQLHCIFYPWISLDDLVWLVSYTYNFGVVFTGRNIGGLLHYWSLAVEEHFYLLWPLAVWALRRRTLMRLCLTVAAVSSLLRVIVVLSGAWPGSAAVVVITPCRLDGLLAGSFVALAWRDPSDWAGLQRYVGRLVLGSGCLLFGIALGQRHFLPYVKPWQVGHDAAVNGNLVATVGIAALAVFFAGLVALAVDATDGSRLRRLLENTGLRAIGKYSYAIYIFHSLILLWTVQLFSPLSHAPRYIAKPVAVVWVLAASFVAAWLSYHLYEKHFLRLKRFFEYQEPAHSATLVPSQCLSYRNA
jgi:peptidoglycan/LPS O-acetylase OafA/YrhL